MVRVKREERARRPKRCNSATVSWAAGRRAVRVGLAKIRLNCRLQEKVSSVDKRAFATPRCHWQCALTCRSWLFMASQVFKGISRDSPDAAYHRALRRDWFFSDTCLADQENDNQHDAHRTRSPLHASSGDEIIIRGG